MLAHALVTSVSRRRHDIGILKTIGFTRRQVSATVSWQATALMLVVLAVGLPLGVIAGRWIWALFANQLGVTAEAPLPWVFVVCVVPAALLLGNLVAAIPAWSARNTKALATLRAE
jgi:ABC-type lipoprotein release transport system permease subunit